MRKYARMSIFLFCSIKLLKSILWQWPDLNFLLVTVDRLYCIDRKKKQNNLPDENCAVFFSFVVLSEHSYVANQFTLGVGLFHLTKRCKKNNNKNKILKALNKEVLCHYQNRCKHKKKETWSVSMLRAALHWPSDLLPPIFSSPFKEENLKSIWLFHLL